MAGPASRVFVAGHRGLVGSAIVRRLEREPGVQVADRHPRSARPPRSGRGELLVPRQPAGVRLPRGRNGRRHSRQLDAARRVHLRQHADSRHGGARRAPLWREEAALPRQLLHLPARLRAADDGVAAADRRARADQRAIRDRQDRRHQAVPGLPQPVRIEFHLRDADQSLRPQRQLRSRQLARPAGDDAEVPRGEERRAARRRDLGHRHAAPRVPARRRSRRRLRVPDGALRRPRPHQRRHRRGRQHPRAGGDDPRRSSIPDATLTFDTSKPDGMPRKLLDVSRLHALGWRHRIPLGEGIADTYRWFLANQGQLRLSVAATT